jgi:WhiB family transcriptional regulator, redox-sensing transcriptional regulator
MSVRLEQSVRVDQTWQDLASCRGPQRVLFFPPSHFERKEDKDVREATAKQVCGDCSVRSDCLQFALNIREPHGIWGGTTELERRSILARLAG